MESMMKENGQNPMELGAIWDFPEDDVFYEELRRQVLILTAEDDEDCRENQKRNAAKSLLPSPAYFYNWSGSDVTDSVPRWPANTWSSRTGSGTGVFIPQASNKSRRRNKPRKNGSENGRALKPVQNMA